MMFSVKTTKKLTTSDTLDISLIKKAAVQHVLECTTSQLFKKTPWWCIQGLSKI